MDTASCSSGQISSGQTSLLRQPGLQPAPSDAALHQRAGENSLPVNISRMEKYASLGVGGAMLLAGLSKGRLPGLLLTIGGGSLLYRGLTGHCHGYDLVGIDTSEQSTVRVIPAQQGQHAEEAATINASPHDLYSFWRHFENLSQILPHVKQVTSTGSDRTHWVAEGPFGRDVEWDAEVYTEREGELISWRSLPGSEIDTAGSVRFTPLPHDRGTEVRLVLKYNPPGGKFGAFVALLQGRGLEYEISEALRNLKRKFEAGELPTNGSDR
jgi:uncharacterized membrane protein